MPQVALQGMAGGLTPARPRTARQVDRSNATGPATPARTLGHKCQGGAHDTTWRRQIQGVGAGDTRNTFRGSVKQESTDVQALLMPEEGLEPPTRGL
jgi:hypothetical protein